MAEKCMSTLQFSASAEKTAASFQMKDNGQDDLRRCLRPGKG